MEKSPPTLTNPHNVNQYTGADPRQQLFIALYIDPQSDTFSNAYQSALKAGYSQQYAEQITQQAKWFSEIMEENDIVEKAEENLRKLMNLDTTSKRERVGLWNAKLEGSKFVLERLYGKKYAKVDHVKNTHLHASLSELRKLKNEEKQANEAQNEAL